MMLDDVSVPAVNKFYSSGKKVYIIKTKNSNINQWVAHFEFLLIGEFRPTFVRMAILVGYKSNKIQ